jgi:hypothetical protein
MVLGSISQNMGAKELEAKSQGKTAMAEKHENPC